MILLCVSKEEIITFILILVTSLFSSIQNY